MPSAYFKTEGLIMKKTPYGEADFLVRALTKDFGKMDALAKGARKTASKLNAHLDILNHTRLQFVKNGERMPTMTDAEVISGFGNWFLDANRISTAGRILKTIDLVVCPARKTKNYSQWRLIFSSPMLASLWLVLTKSERCNSCANFSRTKATAILCPNITMKLY